MRSPRLLAPAVLFLWAATPVLDTYDLVEVNWSVGKLVATANSDPSPDIRRRPDARLDAEMKALRSARRHVMEALGRTLVTVKETGRDRLRSPAVRARVEGIVDGCPIRGKRYYSSGSVEVVLECPLAGGLALALAPLGPRKPSRGIEREAEPQGPTSLIVDASGLKMNPVLLPTLIDGAGTVFEPSMIRTEALRTKGGVVYTHSLAEARGHARAGERPLVVDASSFLRKKGLRLSGRNAEVLRRSNLSFLADGRLLIVLAPR